MVLGKRFEEALLYALEVHRRQTRKGSDIPYIGHLLGVASIVLEAVGDEDQAVAALLHDTVEDSPTGAVVLEEVRERWGDRVGEIVLALSDAIGDGKAKPAWRPRKEEHLLRLRTERDPGILRVTLADKLYNARSMLLDLRRGQDIWERFSAPRSDQLWLLQEFSAIFQTSYPGALQEEFAQVVREIETFPAV